MTLFLHCCHLGVLANLAHLTIGGIKSQVTPQICPPSIARPELSVSILHRNDAFVTHIKVHRPRPQTSTDHHYWNILKYVEICWNILKYNEIYWNILKWSKVHLMAKTEGPTTFWAAAAGAKDKLSWVVKQMWRRDSRLTAVKCSQAVL